MKIDAKIAVLFLTGVLFSFGCSKETVDPNLTGSIEGQVLNSSTGEPVPSASISTNPGTDAILSDQNGQFAFNDIPTGNYTVQAEKLNYDSKSVRVSVEESRTATAQILLGSDNASSNGGINAEVTNFFNTERNDSSFVDVDYMIENTGGEITGYEIYFKIHTSGTSFFEDITGDSLDSGERDNGSFKKYIRKFNADSVTISGIYVPGS